MQPRVIGVRAEGFGIVRRRLIQSANPCQGGAKHGLCPGQVRLKLERQLQLTGGVGGPFNQQCDAQGKPQLGAGRGNPKSRPGYPGGLFITPLPGQKHREAFVRLGIPRSQVHCLAGVLGGLVQAPLQREQPGQGHLRASVVRVVACQNFRLFGGFRASPAATNMQTSIARASEFCGSRWSSVRSTSTASVFRPSSTRDLARKTTAGADEPKIQKEA